MYRKAVREAAISEENPSSSGRMVLLRYYSSTSHSPREPLGLSFVGESLRNFSAGWRLVFMQMALCNTFSRRSKTRKHSSLSLLLFSYPFPLLLHRYFRFSYFHFFYLHRDDNILLFRSSSNVPSIL